MYDMATGDDAKTSALYIRTEADLLRALDEEAAVMSAQTGLKVSRSDVARLVLRRAMAHRLDPARQPPPLPSGSAPASPAPPASSPSKSSAKPVKPAPAKRAKRKV